MQPGEVVLAHNLRRILGQNKDGKPTATGEFVAPIHEDFVFVYLGLAKRTGDPFAVEEAMKRLGWQR